MNITPRSLLVAGATLAGSWCARSQKSGDVMIAQQVADRIKVKVGMKYCAKWRREFVPEVPVEFVPTQKPFRQLEPSRA